MFHERAGKPCWSVRLRRRNFVCEWLVVGAHLRSFIFLVGPNLRRLRMVDGFHRDHLVAPFLVIAIRNSHHQHILRNLELTFLADRQKPGMLMIHRTHVVLHIIGSEHVLRTQLLVRIDLSNADRSPNAAETRYSMLLCAARNGLHLFDHGALVVFLACKRGKGQREGEECNQYHLSVHKAPFPGLNCSLSSSPLLSDVKRKAAGRRPPLRFSRYFLGSVAGSFIVPFVTALFELTSNACADLTNDCGFSFSSS